MCVCPCASSAGKLQPGPWSSQWTKAQGVDHSLESSSELHSHTSGLNHTAVVSAPNHQHTVCNAEHAAGSAVNWIFWIIAF